MLDETTDVLRLPWVLRRVLVGSVEVTMNYLDYISSETCRCGSRMYIRNYYEYDVPLWNNNDAIKTITNAKFLCCPQCHDIMPDDETFDRICDAMEFPDIDGLSPEEAAKVLGL